MARAGQRKPAQGQRLAVSSGAASWMQRIGSGKERAREREERRERGHGPSLFNLRYTALVVFEAVSCTVV